MDEEGEDGIPCEALVLYHQAFRKYGTTCLWHMKPVDRPHRGHLADVAAHLRLHGWKNERMLAAEMDLLCR